MTKKEIIMQWLVPVVVRGLAWFFAVKLGIEAAKAETLAGSAGQAIGALALVGVSVYTSLKGRDKLLKKTPPAVLLDPSADGPPANGAGQ
jgi:hypothetical protein